MKQKWQAKAYYKILTSSYISITLYTVEYLTPKY